MSYAREVTLFCDECCDWERHETGSVAKARRMARAGGWTWDRAHDRCARCSSNRARGAVVDPLPRQEG